jgi:hypothetical protein
MGITVSTSPQQVTASVSEDKITAAVSSQAVTATVQAGVGASGVAGSSGASGSSGVVTVSAPLTNSGTSSAAALALSVGSGLDVSAGSLVVSAVPLSSLAQGGATAGQVVRWNGTAWSVGNVTAGSTAWDDILGKPTFATVATTGSYADLTGKPTIPSAYTLPTATDSVLGGVKIGSGISIDGNGVISSASSYTLPTATGSVLGGVKIGSGVSILDGVISVSTSYAAVSHTHAASAITDFSTAALAAVTWTTITGKPTFGTLATQDGTFSGTSSGTNTGDQTITLTGDVTGSGTGSFSATLSSTGVSAGTYTSVTVDAKGRVTAGSSPTVAYSSLSGVPSTFSPTAHKSSHAAGGSDALTASDIGAASTSHASTHASSGSDPVTIAASQITGLTINTLSKTLQRFTARDNQPPATNFATLDTRNSILVVEFDAATEESAYFVGVVDESMTLTSGLTVRLWWMADTATSGNVRWGVQLEKTGTDMDADSFDTNAQATSAANGTSGVESVASITITSIDSLTAGDRYRLRVYRVAADATNDTMTGDAQLVAVEVRAA